MRTANIPVNNSIVKNTVLNAYNDIVNPVDSIAIYEHVCENTMSKRILTLNLVGTTPTHLKGWELVRNRGMVTMGISPGNGYFSRDRLEVILTGMANYFTEVTVIVPDLPSLHTYRALGYDEHHSIERMKKHKRDRKVIYNQLVEQIWKSYGRRNLRFITWSDDVVHHSCYQRALDYAIELYASNDSFKEAILRNTERYILARLEEQDVHQLGGMKRIVEKAAYYLIEEMAFHEILPLILGTEPIISYYRELELVSNYLDGKYNNPISTNIGVVVYNII